MSKAMHTPGMWVTYVNKWPDEVVIRSMFPDGAERAWVAKTNAANARLISAAPDLLEALQSAVAWFSRLEDWSGVGDPDIQKYQAAITKATGEQP